MSTIAGLDEAGRGPVIGPMVMAIVESTDSIMHSLGVKDSKLLSPSAREKLYERIQSEATYVNFKIITAEELNLEMQSKTLNVIEQECAVYLARNVKTNEIYVDAFDINEDRLSSLLSEKTGKIMICKHKGDVLFPTVSAASIIAKVIRDREVRKIGEKFGEIGSGYPADPKTVAFLHRCRENNIDITTIARTHWITYKRMFSSGRQMKF
jgi:ribonuclease H, mammalian HI/archaeal HII subfamily